MTTPPTIDVVKETSVKEVVAGSRLQYTLAVINRGECRASFSLNERIEAPASFLTLQVARKCSPWMNVERMPPVGGQGTILIRVDGLPSEEEVEFRITVRIDSAASDGEVVTNTAEVKPASGASFSVTGLKVPIRARASIRLDKLGPKTAPRCSTIGYSLRLINQGPSDARNVVLTDYLAHGTQLLRAQQTCGPVFSKSFSCETACVPTVQFSIPQFTVGSVAMFEVVVAVTDKWLRSIRNRADVTSVTLHTCSEEANVSVLTRLIDSCRKCKEQKEEDSESEPTLLVNSRGEISVLTHERRRRPPRESKKRSKKKEDKVTSSGSRFTERRTTTNLSMRRVSGIQRSRLPKPIASLLYSE